MKSHPIDLYSIIHFLNFFILGLILKNKYAFAFVIGIVWEVFEYYVTHHDYTSALIKKYWPIPQKYWDESNCLNPVFDIFFNMSGYYLGNNINNINNIKIL